MSWAIETKSTRNGAPAGWLALRRKSTVIARGGR